MDIGTYSCLDKALDFKRLLSVYLKGDQYLIVFILKGFVRNKLVITTFIQLLKNCF